MSLSRDGSGVEGTDGGSCSAERTRTDDSPACTAVHYTRAVRTASRLT